MRKQKYPFTKLGVFRAIDGQILPLYARKDRQGGSRLFAVFGKDLYLTIEKTEAVRLIDNLADLIERLDKEHPNAR